MGSQINPLLLKKLEGLSSQLQDKIKTEHDLFPNVSTGEVSNFITKHMLHCNAGRIHQAGLALKRHCDNGGKIFISMSGAGSTFKAGRTICRLIRAGKVAGISVTGANLEESLYLLIAPDCYVHIPDYMELTPKEEKELDHAGLRRITDTFLPEEESVRIVLEPLMKLWRAAEKEGREHLWHEFFFQLFEHNLLQISPEDAEDCWLYQCWRHNIPVTVPGWEDSTMGNIFTWACYNGSHPVLSKYKLEDGPISLRVAKPPVCYMHELAGWYMNITQEYSLAFLQLGGGIAADFPICVVPHLKKDYFGDLSIEEQERLVRTWAGFVEVNTVPMSQGSYTGAEGKEKITWSKLEPDSFRFKVESDYTIAFPLLAALILDM